MVNLIREYIRELLTENRLSSSELKALQTIKDGLGTEQHASKAAVVNRLIDMGLVTGDSEAGTTHRKTRRGFQPVRYGRVQNMALTPEGEAALSTALEKSDNESIKYKKIIMQAVIDANGPILDSDLPGYNPKTHKLRGRYRKAYDELRGWGSDIYALNTENTPRGRSISQGLDFERIKSELGL